ncbi:MAG: ROK family protein [Pseudomonadota bacterium]
MRHHKTYLCFDLGGTFIKYGIVSSQGDMLFHGKLSTPKEPQPQDVISIIIHQIKQALQQHDIDAIGVSSHGVVDPQKGCITCGSHYVTHLVDFPLVKNIQQITQLPACIENDVKAAALGELWQGQAKQFSNSVFLTLGSSIGGAIIINGELYRGVNNCAGEIGYLITDEGDTNKHCFFPGAWERKASASVLVKRYRQLKDQPNAKPADFTKALMQADGQAQHIFDEFLYSLNSGLISLAHTLAPEAIIIGGGITEMGDFLFTPVERQFKKRVLDGYQFVKILPATLGNQGALFGMAYSCSKLT